MSSENINNGQNIKLSNMWTLWSHDLYNKDWEITSYKNLFRIKSVSDFWKVINNFHKLGIKSRHFFLMRGTIQPIWEDESNKYGGVCSFRIEINKCKDVVEYLSCKMVCRELNDDFTDITGLSFSPKNNWAIIKIWNKNSKNDLSKTLNKDILEKYSEISIKYKPNEPEY